MATTQLQGKINKLKAAGKVVFVYCIYGPAASKRRHHDDSCCIVHAFDRNDRRGIATAMRIHNGT